ncbi:MAG: hypothetical protein II631_05810, partial [Treponema sp.]|nr:hypothetical protein [Treponema sp.]
MASWKALSQAVNTLADSDVTFPADITGCKGSLNSFFISRYMERRRVDRIHEEQFEGKFSSTQEDFVIVVPTKKEADECETDLETLLGDKAELLQLPGWEMLPYRP